MLVVSRTERAVRQKVIVGHINDALARNRLFMTYNMISFDFGGKKKHINDKSVARAANQESLS